MIAGTLTYSTKMDTKGLQEGANRFGTSIKRIVAGLGIDRIISGAFNMINSSLDGAISRLDTLNNFPKVMSNLGIDAQSSQKAIDDLSERIKGIPTTLDDAAMAVERFTSKNEDVQESVEIFDAVNNAILAGGASADIQKSALEQLSQAYSKGKPDMMEWRTLQMAMPAQLNQVAKAMGKTTDALGEDLRNGKVSMNDFIGTFIQLNKEGVNGFESFEKQAKNSTGGIKTSITNMKTAVTRGVADIVQSVNEGLKDAGLGGIGDVLKTIGETAEKVLKFIGEKARKYIPPTITFIKNAITTIKNGLTPLINFVKNTLIPIFKTIYDTSKRYLQKLSPIFEPLKKILHNLEPTINAVIVAFLAFKVVTTVVAVIEKVKKAFVAFQLFLSKMSTSMMGWVGAIIIVIGLVASAVKAFSDKSNESFKNADEEMRRHVANMGKAFDEYGNKIQNATSKTDAFNRELFISADKDQQIMDEMSSIQESITDITYKAHEERRALSQGEIDKVDEYLRKLEELSGKYFEVTQMQGEAIRDQVLTSFEQLQDEGFDKFADNYAGWLKTVQENEENATKSVNDNTTQRIALLNAEWEGRDKSSEAYKNEYNAIVESGNKKIEAIKDTSRQVVETAENELQERMTINQQDLDNATSMLELRNGVYQQASEASTSIWNLDKLKFATIWGEKKSEIENNNKEITRIMSEENTEQLGIWAKSLEESAKYGGEISAQDLQMANDILGIYESLNDDSKKEMEGMYTSLKNVVKTQGPGVTSETDTVAKNTKEKFNDFDSEGHTAGTNLILGLIRGLEGSAGGALGTVGRIASSILSRFKSGLQEKSPSKATEEMGEFLDLGLIKGIENKRQSIMDAVKGLGNEVLDKMSNAVNVESGKINAQAMLSSNVNRTIQINASFNGDVELDNRRVGKIIAPDVSRAIKAGGL